MRYISIETEYFWLGRRTTHLNHDQNRLVLKTGMFVYKRMGLRDMDASRIACEFIYS